MLKKFIFRKLLSKIANFGDIRHIYAKEKFVHFKTIIRKNELYWFLKKWQCNLCKKSCIKNKSTLRKVHNLTISNFVDFNERIAYLGKISVHVVHFSKDAAALPFF